MGVERKHSMASAGTAILVLGLTLLLHSGWSVLENRQMAKAAGVAFSTPAMIWLEVTLGMVASLFGSIFSSGALQPAHAKAECAERSLDVVASCLGFASFNHRGGSLAK